MTPIATAVHDRLGRALQLAALGLAACGLSVLALTVAGRIAFPWPLVLGMRFCDLAPAAIGDAILQRYRFRIHSPQ